MARRKGYKKAQCSVIARLDRAIQYPTVGDYWIARSSRAMTAEWVSSKIGKCVALLVF